MSAGVRRGDLADVLGKYPGPVPTFQSYVNGHDVVSEKYIYTTTTRSILDDTFGSLTLKRRLEQGLEDPAAATDSIVGRCAVASLDTVQLAITAAAAAAPEWAATPLATRMRLGAGIRDRLHLVCADLIEVLVAEGSPRSLVEWQVSGLFETFSAQTLRWCEQQMYQEFAHDGRRLIVRRVPDGVVCVNPPQNAPAPSALFGITPLLAGNPVVLRAPRSAPLGLMYAMRELVVPVLAELGAPPGTLNVFCGRPRPVMRAWLDHPEVKDIFFTGDVQRGLDVQRECVERGKKPILELAGNDSVVVWRDANLDLAVEALVECFYGSGQICMVPNQVIAHPAIAEELLTRLCAAAAQITPGFPEQPGVLLSPVLRSERFFAYIRDAVDHGARVLRGARRLEVDGSVSDTGLFLEPTVIRIDGLSTCREIRAVREETFFPLLPVVVPAEADDSRLLTDVIDFVNSNPYGLRNSLWSSSEVVIDDYLRRVVNGGVLKVNDSHVGFLPYLPSHGGTGLTGGVYGEANYLMLRTSHLQGVSLATNVSPRAAVLAAYKAARHVQPSTPDKGEAMRFLGNDRQTCERLLPGLLARLSEVTLTELEAEDSVAINMFRSCGGTNLLVPKAYGGIGANALEAVRTIRALAAVAPSMTVATMMHHFSVGTLYAVADAVGAGNGLDDLLLKRVAGERLLVASGFAEGRTGQGILAPQMEARPVDGGYRITGSKKPCSLSRSMDLLTASVGIRDDGGELAMGLLMLPARTEGLTVHPFWSTFALAGAESQEVRLTDVFVTDEQIIKPDPALADAMTELTNVGLIWFQMTVCAAYTGIVSALVERVLAGERGSVSDRAALAARVESAALLAEGLARRIEDGDVDNDALAASLVTRFAVQDALAHTVDQAVELLGGMAYVGAADVAYLAAASHAIAFHPPSRSSVAGALVGYYHADQPMVVE